MEEINTLKRDANIETINEFNKELIKYFSLINKLKLKIKLFKEILFNISLPLIAELVLKHDISIIKYGTKKRQEIIININILNFLLKSVFIFYHPFYKWNTYY